MVYTLSHGGSRPNRYYETKGGESPGVPEFLSGVEPLPKKPSTTSQATEQTIASCNAKRQEAITAGNTELLKSQKEATCSLSDFPGEISPQKGPLNIGVASVENPVQENRYAATTVTVNSIAKNPTSTTEKPGIPAGYKGNGFILKDGKRVQ